jgi:hypothetical protein
MADGAAFIVKTFPSRPLYPITVYTSDKRRTVHTVHLVHATPYCSPRQHFTVVCAQVGLKNYDVAVAHLRTVCGMNPANESWVVPYAHAYLTQV